MKRTRAKRRPPGVGCQHHGRRSCRRDAVTSVTIAGQPTRLCAMHAADELFQKDVRESGPCWAEGYRFGCAGGTQAAHIIGRARHAIRWSHDNCKPLCAGHHKWFTHNPDAWRSFVADQGVDYYALRIRGDTEPPMDPFDVIARYRKREASEP
jgi:hypothetical protein